MALVGRCGPIGEDMPKMAPAAGAAYFGAYHAVALVLHLRDVFGIKRSKEAGPARAGLEFIVRPEKRKIAEAAHKDAGPVFVKKASAKGRFGAGAKEYPALFGRKALYSLLANSG